MLERIRAPEALSSIHRPHNLQTFLQPTTHPGYPSKTTENRGQHLVQPLKTGVWPKADGGKREPGLHFECGSGVSVLLFWRCSCLVAQRAEYSKDSDGVPAAGPV